MYYISIIRNNIGILGFRNLWTSSSNFMNRSQLLRNEHKSDTDSENTTNAQTNETDEEYENKIKMNILNESLNFVNQYGWSKEAISAGAESINYPGIIHGLFPNGGVDLIQHFNKTCNEKLNEEMEKYFIESDTNTPPKVPERVIEEAIQKRLEMLIPYKKQWPQALALMSIPTNLQLSLSNVTTLVDNICFYAGDKSINMNWYARRIGVTGIYKTTELYMLQDTSPNHKNTWDFLNRRIMDAVELNKISTTLTNLPPPEKIVNQTRDVVNAMYITAQNMLGLSWRK